MLPALLGLDFDASLLRTCVHGGGLLVDAASYLKLDCFVRGAGYAVGAVVRALFGRGAPGGFAPFSDEVAVRLCSAFKLQDGLAELRDLVLCCAQAPGEFTDEDGLLCSEVVLRHGERVVGAEVCGEDEVLLSASESRASRELSWVDVPWPKREQVERTGGADGVDFLLRMRPAYLGVSGTNGADERVNRWLSSGRLAGWQAGRREASTCVASSFIDKGSAGQLIYPLAGR